MIEIIIILALLFAGLSTLVPIDPIKEAIESCDDEECKKVLTNDTLRLDRGINGD